MSSRDRFFQSLSNARTQLESQLENSSLNFGAGNHPPSSHPSASTSTSNSGSNSGSSSLRRNDTTATLPLYSRTTSGPSVPAEILNASPGQAQSQADRITSQRTQDRRRRARGVASNDDDANGSLKRVHGHPSLNGKINLDLFTPPQRTPTYMGGTIERGRGALTGQISLETSPQERISSIRLKLKCVARVSIPLHDPRQSSGPISLEGRSPAKEALNEKEVLLLQIEQQIYASTPSNTEHLFELGHGFHELPFRFELPVIDGKGGFLPPSFVLESDGKVDERLYQSQNRNQTSGLGYKASLIRAAKGHLPESLGKKEWASVRWYVKLTVERPGMFKVNDRIFAPFSYLPPPTRKMSNLLISRLDFTSTLRSQSTLPSRVISNHPSWKTSRIFFNEDGQVQDLINGKNSAGLFSNLFGKGKSKEKGLENQPDRWSISIPDPPIFPLRSLIPMILRLDNPTQFNSNTSTIPLVELFSHVQLLSKGPSSSNTGFNLVAVSPAVIERQSRTTAYGKALEWQGLIDVPASLGPCFETNQPLLKLEYFVGVRLNSNSPICHAETLVLACAPPNVVPRTSVPPTPSSDPDPSSIVPFSNPSNSKKGKRKASPNQFSPSNAEAGPSNSVRPPPSHPSVYLPEKDSHSHPQTSNTHTHVQELSNESIASSVTSTSSSSQQPSSSVTTSNHHRLGSLEEDDIGTGMELPPSYYEATGLHDAE